MQITKDVFILIVLFNSLTISFGQFQGFKEVPDSLIIKSYHSLYTYYYNSFDNIKESDVYATAFLKKAYLDKDTLNLANGYYMITYNTTDKNFVYNDSLLKYAALLPDNQSSSFAWYAYQGKGGYYTKKRDFKNALDNHLNALNAAKKANNSDLKNISTTNLGLLRQRVGQYKESLIDFKENYRYELERFNNLENADSVSLKSFLNSICLLANSYRLNKKYDSAQYFNKKVFDYIDYQGAERYIGIARVNSAEVEHTLGNYNNTIDSVNRAIPILLKQKNIPNLAVAYFLKGMSYKTQNKELAIDNLKLMDSIFSINNDLQPSLRSGYLYLVDYHKKQKDLTNQLYYINQLLKFDSIVHDYSMYIAEGVYEDDRKNLISIQKSLKSEINKASDFNRIIIAVSLILVGILIFEIFRRSKKNKLKIREYQIQFDDLLKSKNETKEEKTGHKKSNVIEISESLVEELVLKLEVFQSKKGFLDKKISANKLAKELGSNANYLGQIIKYKYGVNFRQYINNLRIEYVLNLLRNDRRMINYSIQAIADEAGYNHAEPFSKAFLARTGYYPSEFILKMKEKNSMKIVS